MVSPTTTSSADWPKRAVGGLTPGSTKMSAKASSAPAEFETDKRIRKVPADLHACRTVVPSAESPSSNLQLIAVGEFVDSLVSVTLCPTSTTLGKPPMIACGGLTPSTTVMIALVVLDPAALPAVRETSKEPGSSNTWVTTDPDATSPSPNDQSSDSGSPVDSSTNSIVSPTSTVSLRNEKSAVGTRSTSSATTVTSSDCSASSPRAFATNSVTVYTPSVSQILIASGPSLPVPSPKSQFHDVGLPVDSSVNSTASPAFTVCAEKLKLATSSSPSDGWLSMGSITIGEFCGLTGASFGSRSSVPGSSPPPPELFGSVASGSSSTSPGPPGT